MGEVKRALFVLNKAFDLTLHLQVLSSCAFAGFCFFDSFGVPLQKTGPEGLLACSSFSLAASFLPYSQRVLHQDLLLAVSLPVTRHDPSQTCDESSVKSTAFIPGREQKGYLCGKAVISKCKLLDKCDRVLLESEPGMPKVLCYGYTPHLALWQSHGRTERIPSSHLSVPCSLTGVSGLWPCGRVPQLPW